MSKKTNPEFSGNFEKFVFSGDIGAFVKFGITKVMYNEPATIVFWSDGTKTVCKAQDGDIYNAETGLALCVLKKLASPTQVRALMEDWIPNEGNIVTIKDVRRKRKCKSNE